MKTIIKETEERKAVTLSEETLVCCPDCNSYHSEHIMVSLCNCGCERPFYAGDKVICSEGRHYHKTCFRQMQEAGLVEEEKKSSK